MPYRFNIFTNQLDLTDMANSSGGISNVNANNGISAAPNTGDVILSGVDATTSSVGVASFDPTYFTVNSGVVTLSGFPNWTIINQPTIQMVPNVSYINNYTDTVTFILPVSCPIGSIIRIAGGVLSANPSWIIQQNAGQSIWRINQQSTVGITGGLSANAIGVCLELLCIQADTQFQSIFNATQISVF